MLTDVIQRPHEKGLNRASLPDNEIWQTQRWQGALALKAKKPKP